MKKVYKHFSALFVAIATVCVVLSQNEAATAYALVAVAYAVLSVGGSA